MADLSTFLRPGHQGAVYQAQYRIALAKRKSPKGRAGMLGGLVTARKYPTSLRPRDEHGRWLPGPLPTPTTRKERRAFATTRVAHPSAPKPMEVTDASRPAGRQRPAGRAT